MWSDISPERAQDLLDAMLEERRIEIMPATDLIARGSVAAFAAYGKGRSLTLADCVSYACAKTLRAPMLFIGDDFARTDLVVKV